MPKRILAGGRGMTLALTVLVVPRFVGEAGASPATDEQPSVAEPVPQPAAGQSAARGQAADAGRAEGAPAPDVPSAPEVQSFVPWRMATRNIDLRLRPNAGFRLHPLFPSLSPQAADASNLGASNSSLTSPWSLRISLAALDVHGERQSAKFQEFGDVRDGIAAGVEAHYRDGNRALNLVGRHLGLGDQDLAFDGGQAGKYLVGFGYDETPHNFSFDSRSLYAGVGTGQLTISERIRSDLQSSTSAQDAADKIAAYVDGSAQSVDIGLRRQRVGLDFTLMSAYPFTIRATVGNESRDGVRPLTGSFGLGNFEELPFPVSYDTRDVRVTFEYAKPESRLYAQGAYRLSSFDNHISTLRFDNPYRVTDSSQGSVGATFAAGPSQGLIALPPSNTYQEATLTSVLSQLPGRGSLSGLVSLGFFRQNEPLVPFSTNTSVVPGGPNAPPFTATDPASLPRATAEAAMNTALAQARLTTQPADRLRLVAQYRFYRLDNDETPFTIPAFVREDADVRRPATPGASYRTVLATYDRHTASAEASLDVTGETRLGLAYTFERTNRDFREVTWMNDKRLKVSLDTRPASWLDLKASYERSVRDTSDYIFNQYNVAQGNQLESPMLPFLRKFDEADRDRDEAQVIATSQVTDALSLSGMAVYGRDRFSKSPFGLLEDNHRAFSLDASYTFTEHLSLYASYTFERYSSVQKARQWTPTSVSNPYTRETGLDSNSNWEARPRDDSDTASVGFEAYLVPRRLRLNVAYTYSKTDGVIGYASPVGVAANDTNAFDPAPFTNVDDVRFHSANAELEYRFSRRLALTAAYLFQKYAIDDINYSGFTYTPRNPAGGINAGLLMGSYLFAPYNVNVFAVRLELGL